MRTRYNASESLLLGATSYTTAYNYGLAPLPFRTFTPYSRNVVYAGNDKQNSRRPQLNLQHVPFEGLENIEILGRSQKGIGYQTHISTRTPLARSQKLRLADRYGRSMNTYQGTWVFVIVLASLWRLCGALWRLRTYAVPFPVVPICSNSPDATRSARSREEVLSDVSQTS